MRSLQAIANGLIVVGIGAMVFLFVRILRRL